MKRPAPPSTVMQALRLIEAVEKRKAKGAKQEEQPAPLKKTTTKKGRKP